jgi:hypothetical protein
VHLLDRHVCEWGGFGHVAVSLDGIAAIVENGIPCDQAILLTGQDFPLKSNDDIKARFARHRGCSFLSWFRGPGQRGMVARRRTGPHRPLVLLGPGTKPAGALARAGREGSAQP